MTNYEACEMFLPSNQMVFSPNWPLFYFNLTNISMNSMSPCVPHQNFGFMLQILAMNSNQSIGISELARLYCQAFSATRGKKLTKELKKCLVALLQTLERWFRKSYCEFVSLFIRFLNKLKVFYL